MKKMIVLSPEEHQLDDEKKYEFMKFAKKHGLKPAGETHYPLMFPMKMPEAFVEILKDRFDDCVYVMDDSCLIFASVFTDGKLVELLEQERISVVHTELGYELSDIYASIDENMKRKLKSAIIRSIEELNGKTQSLDEELNLTIICKHSSDEEIEDYINDLNYRGKINVAAVYLNEYNLCMNSVIEGIIQKNNTDKLVIFDNEINDQEFLEFIDELSLRYNFNYSYKEDGSIMMKMNEMGIS